MDSVTKVQDKYDNAVKYIHDNLFQDHNKLTKRIYRDILDEPASCDSIKFDCPPNNITLNCDKGLNVATLKDSSNRLKCAADGVAYNYPGKDNSEISSRNTDSTEQSYCTEAVSLFLPQKPETKAGKLLKWNYSSSNEKGFGEMVIKRNCYYENPVALPTISFDRYKEVEPIIRLNYKNKKQF